MSSQPLLSTRLLEQAATRPPGRVAGVSPSLMRPNLTGPWGRQTDGSRTTCPLPSAGVLCRLDESLEGQRVEVVEESCPSVGRSGASLELPPADEGGRNRC